ncbi:hypothetical protein GBA52_003131 [Prunus armeniaca]|nr:hypothetical protein GBA52_003131 [Prunus armeniaca]
MDQTSFRLPLQLYHQLEGCEPDTTSPRQTVRLARTTLFIPIFGSSHLSPTRGRTPPCLILASASSSCEEAAEPEGTTKVCAGVGWVVKIRFYP